MTEASSTAREPAGDQLVRRYSPAETKQPPAPEPVKEIGGRKDGTEPTRFGDWEKHGRCIDF